MALVLAREHARDEGANAVHHAHHVDAEDPRPILDGGCPRRTGHTHARVVEKQVHGAEALVGARREILDLIGPGNVATHFESFGSQGCHGFGGGAHPRGVDIGEDDTRAFARAGDRELAPDAAAGPGDDRDPPLQIPH